MTDFENAAFTSFIMLLSRVILAFKLNLYIPMTKLEENMELAGQREACSKGQFWFRSDILPRQGKSEVTYPQAYKLMTVEDILAGKDSFPGLIPLCDAYLDFIRCDSETRAVFQKYMDFILKRAQGKIMTTATWMRRFVMEHPSYKNDSQVPAAAAYDLMVRAAQIGQGQVQCPEVLGDVQIPLVEAASNNAGHRNVVLQSVLKELHSEVPFENPQVAPALA